MNGRKRRKWPQGRQRLLLAVFLCLGTLVGCVSAPLPSGPLPEDLEGSLLQRLDQNAENYQSLSGLAKFKVRTGSRSVSGTQVLLAQKPDHLRTEILNPFGQPVLLLATDGGRLTVQVPGEREYYSGAATAPTLRKFLQIPLRLEDLVQILLYQIPILPYGRTELLLLEEGGWKLVLHGDEGSRQELRFDPLLRLVGAGYYLGEELQLEIRYGKFRDRDGQFPTLAELVMPQQEGELSLAFSDLQTNVAIPSDRFLLQPPPDFDVKPLP